ncbi:hypothetical protein BaRGS_00038960, partial [Batillaria attramentaria]
RPQKALRAPVRRDCIVIAQEFEIGTLDVGGIIVGQKPWVAEMEDALLPRQRKGCAPHAVSHCLCFRATDLKLMLSERGKAEYMGYLNLTCTLIPKTQEDKDQVR